MNVGEDPYSQQKLHKVLRAEMPCCSTFLDVSEKTSMYIQSKCGTMLAIDETK